MKHKLMFNLLATALFLALAPAALAHTTWYVDGVNGNDNNDCKTPQTACKTIAHAISLASSGDSIMVAPATYTEHLTIKFTNLKIIGSDASTTIVDGGGVGRVFTIGHGGLALSELTIRNGYAHNLEGSGIDGYDSTVTVNHCVISGNRATSDGGGVIVSGRLTVTYSTISGNSAGGSGGGIGAAGMPITITNSTISGNSATYGGGISGYFGEVTINNSTISGNGASVSGGNIDGGATIQNSILANATSGGNCNSAMNSEGYNLSSDNTCDFNGPGDMNNTKPKLGELGNHGGPTQTIPEKPGSPTVDAGNPNGCTDSNGKPLTTDQRGDPRPGKYKQDKRCDMGAYERQTD